MNINLSNFGDQNMDTLILTGWGWIDYAAAAALALRACRTADIRGMSTRRLPEYLNSNSARNYKDIYILGIGLTGNSGDLLSALKQLEKKKVHVKWISALELPDGIDPEIRSKITDGGFQTVQTSDRGGDVLLPQLSGRQRLRGCNPPHCERRSGQQVESG